MCAVADYVDGHVDFVVNVKMRWMILVGVVGVVGGAFGVVALDHHDGDDADAVDDMLHRLSIFVNCLWFFANVYAAHVY